MCFVLSKILSCHPIKYCGGLWSIKGYLDDPHTKLVLGQALQFGTCCITWREVLETSQTAAGGSSFWHNTPVFFFLFIRSTKPLGLNRLCKHNTLALKNTLQICIPDIPYRHWYKPGQKRETKLILSSPTIRTMFWPETLIYRRTFKKKFVQCFRWKGCCGLQEKHELMLMCFDVVFWISVTVPCSCPHQTCL